MSTALNSFLLLDRSATNIFFDGPTVIHADKNMATQHQTHLKIEALLIDIKKGPLVALGSFGPSHYSEAPFKLEATVCGREIYGWKRSAERTNQTEPTCAFVIGAEATKDVQRVYYTMCENTNRGPAPAVQTYEPTTTDSKIYATSYKTFCNNLSQLYPAAPDVTITSMYTSTPFRLCFGTGTPREESSHKFAEAAGDFFFGDRH